MKAKELMVVLTIIIILLIVIIVGASGKKESKVDLEQKPEVGEIEENKAEEFVEVKIDGTKVNTSNELSKTKTIEGLEISNIRLTENGNVSQLIADVKNPTNKTLGDFAVNIIIIDKTGKELAKIGGYIDKVEAGETVQLNSSVTVDVANAYDFKISK